MEAEANDSEQATYDTRRLRHRNDWCAGDLDVIKVVEATRVRRAYQGEANGDGGLVVGASRKVERSEREGSTIESVKSANGGEG